MSVNILKQYIDEIYNQADILLEPLEESQLKKELESALIEKIGEASIDMLDDDSKDEYFILMETNPNQDQIREFFVSHVDNFDEKINRTIIDFSSEFILKIKKSIIMASVDIDKYSDDSNDENDTSIEEVLLEQNKNK